MKADYFKQPVVTSEEFDKHLYVTFTPAHDSWKVEITSEKQNGTPLGGNRDENMECQLYLQEDTPWAKELNIEAFMKTQAENGTCMTFTELQEAAILSMASL